jgi:predicted nucleic acid-binding protein
VRFWDSSALVPLLVQEPAARHMGELLQADREIVAWWGTIVECTSALTRRQADKTLDATGFRVATGLLGELTAGWIEVPPAESVREQALRVIRMHRLRAADALQLGAAIVASDFEPAMLEFVTLDSRLAEAAEREGFPLVA